MKCECQNNNNPGRVIEAEPSEVWRIVLGRESREDTSFSNEASRKPSNDRLCVRIFLAAGLSDTYQNRRTREENAERVESGSFNDRLNFSRLTLRFMAEMY